MVIFSAHQQPKQRQFIMDKFFETQQASFYHLSIVNPSTFVLGQQISAILQRIYQMIQKLQQKITEDLCAQQVITNIVDCIKELVDNSIDARSHKIQIVLEDYGKKSIIVTDDGSGISNFQFLGQKGSTSKNQSAHQQIRTLGFRGEALHSIAKVSEKMIIESTQNAGKTKSFNLKTLTQNILEIKRTPGTSVQIQSLFEYLPVRRYELLQKFKDFLKKIDGLIKQYSLMFPEISFILKNIKSDKNEIIIETSKLHGNREEVWKNRIGEVLGAKFMDRMVYINKQNVQGWLLSKIESGSSNENSFIRKNHHFMYLNSRPIDPLPKITETLNFFYRKYKKNTKYAFILNIKANWKVFDINLAPNKREVIIQDKLVEQINNQLRQFINDKIIEEIVCIQQPQQKQENVFVSKKLEQRQQPVVAPLQSTKNQALNRESTKINIPKQNAVMVEEVRNPIICQSVKPTQKPQIQNKNNVQPNKQSYSDLLHKALNQKLNNASKKQSHNSQVMSHVLQSPKKNEPEQKNQHRPNERQKVQQQVNDDDLGQWIKKRTKHSIKKQQFLNFHILGQFNHGFIICLLDGKYYLVDQHAASEKYHFQRLIDSTRQSIQVCDQIQLDPIDIINLETYGEQLKVEGYSYAIKSDNQIRLTRVPAFLGKIYGKEYFLDLLESKTKLKDQRDFYMAAASKACRTAVMIGHILKDSQMEKIVRQLANLRSPWNCPHGRPTLIYLGDQQEFITQFPQNKKQMYQLD